MNPSFSHSKTIRLLKKYGVILIVFTIVNQVIVSLGITAFLSVTQADLSKAQLNLLTTSMSVIVNLIIPLILLTDIDRRSSICWIFFTLGIFAPWSGVTFFIIWTAVIELQHSNQKS